MSLCLTFATLTFRLRSFVFSEQLGRQTATASNFVSVSMSPRSSLWKYIGRGIRFELHSIPRRA